MTALIRRAGAGWERLVIGSVAQGAPCYEPYEWDEQAWEARQRQAEAIRRALVLEMPVVLPATARAVMEL